jgi:hypothetical protein
MVMMLKALEIALLKSSLEPSRWHLPASMPISSSGAVCFSFGLFNDAFSSPHYITLSNRLIGK